MRSRKLPSTVDTASGIVDSVRNERIASEQPAQTQANEIRKWLSNRLEFYKRQILESNGVPQQVVASSETDPSVVRSPAYKKLKPSPKPAAAKTKNPLPNEIVAGVNAMKVKELQAALRSRELNANGRKVELRERLLVALEEEQALQCEQQQQRKQPSAKKPQQQPTGDGATDKSAKSTSSSSSSGEQRYSTVMVDLVEETDSMRISETKKVSDDGVAAASSGDAGDVVAAKETVPGAVSSDDDENAGQSNTNGDVEMQDVDSNNVGKSASKQGNETNTARSPLKRVQEGVNSTMKALSSKKSPLKGGVQKSPFSGGQKSPAKVDPIDRMSISETNSPAKKEAPVQAPSSNVEKPKSKKVLDSDNSVRKLGAPSSGGLGSGPSSIQKGNSALKSQKFQAKNEARMAKLKEMREKSKPLSSAAKSFKAPAEYLSTVSTLKSNAGSSSQADKRRLAAEMRAKTATLQKQQQNKEPVATSTTARAPVASSSKPTSSSTSSKSKREGDLSSALKKTPSSSAKSTRSEILSPVSPLDTYELSDADDGDSESDSDDDSYNYNSKPKKYIPQWATKSNLMSMLDTQFAMGGPDPDVIFGEVETCDLQAIFSKSKLRYKKRTSSGMWTHDRATSAEKLAYKRTMHYGIQQAV